MPVVRRPYIQIHTIEGPLIIFVDHIAGYNPATGSIWVNATQEFRGRHNELREHARLIHGDPMEVPEVARPKPKPKPKAKR